MKKIIYNNQISWIIILLFIATGTSFIKFVELNDGGAMTFMSLGILWLISYFFGFNKGILAGFIFGFIKFGVTYITGESINYNPGALILEYPIAFMGMSLGALLPQNRKCYRYIVECRKIRKNTDSLDPEEYEESEYYDGSINTERLLYVQGDEELENSHRGLIYGYLTGILFILIVYIISALLFYDVKAGMTASKHIIYTIVYDSSYLFFEALLTVIIFLIPFVYKSITYLKHVALNPKDIPSIYGF